jgi:hypothetical protein
MRKALLVAAGVCTLAIGQVGGIVSAATTTPTNKAASSNSPSALKISPLRTSISIAPGGTGTVKVYVSNVTKQQMTLQAVENDFVAKDESGTPALILDNNSYAPTHSLKRFMVPVPNVTVAPGKTEPVTVGITVPKTAQAGGYFGAIRFVAAGSGSQAVALNSSVASLILLTVPGPTVEQLLLTNFDVEQNGGTATNFRTPNGLGLFLRFQNKGNLQEAPFGQINVLKGKKIVYTANFNQDDPKDEILPDSARRWTVPIKNLGKFGKYTVNGTFAYGTKGQSIEITKTVWIVPTAYILGVVGGILLLALIVGGTWFFLRSYKRKILQSSRRRY